jgi:hypothetical protein
MKTLFLMFLVTLMASCLRVRTVQFSNYCKAGMYYYTKAQLHFDSVKTYNYLGSDSLTIKHIYAAEKYVDTLENVVRILKSKKYRGVRRKYKLDDPN